MAFENVPSRVSLLACSGNPNYPGDAVVGDCYTVSVAGRIGGASGPKVNIGDSIMCVEANVGGTEASVGTSWQITTSQSQGDIIGFRSPPTWQNVAATSGTDSACTNGTLYYASVFIPRGMTATSIWYLVGSVGGTDKVVLSLHDDDGVLLANTALAGTTVGTAATAQQVDLVTPTRLIGGRHYVIGATFNGTTAKFRTIPAHCSGGTQAGTGTQTFGTAATFALTVGFTADKGPVAFIDPQGV